jgi:hypothetical protein
MSGLARLASYGSTVGKLSQPTRICLSHAEGVSRTAKTPVPPPPTGPRHCSFAVVTNFPIPSKADATDAFVIADEAGRALDIIPLGMLLPKSFKN